MPGALPNRNRHLALKSTDCITVQNSGISPIEFKSCPIPKFVKRNSQNVIAAGGPERRRFALLGRGVDELNMLSLLDKPCEINRVAKIAWAHFE